MKLPLFLYGNLLIHFCESFLFLVWQHYSLDNLSCGSKLLHPVQPFLVFSTSTDRRFTIFNNHVKSFRTWCKTFIFTTKKLIILYKSIYVGKWSGNSWDKKSRIIVWCLSYHHSTILRDTLNHKKIDRKGPEVKWVKKQRVIKLMYTFLRVIVWTQYRIILIYSPFEK